MSKDIERLLGCDVIERLDEPPTWINPIVPVSKSGDKIRICLNMRRANEAIIRET